MSYNLVDPTTGDLTRVAGNSNIVDTAIETTSTWSSSKIYSAINSIGFKGDAPENANSATTPGVYLINRNDDAYPVRQGYLIVSKPRQDYDCILQEVYYFNANKIYSRGCWFNSWYDWQELATNDDIFRVGDRRNTIGWADLSNDVDIDGSSNYANNVGRIEGHNAMIKVSNPSISYQWPVTNLGDNNNFMDFGGAIQFFTDKVNNHLYVRFADSVDMSAWGEIATMDKVAQCVENKKPDAKTVSFELNSASWNCGTIYGNTNNGGNFKYDYYVTSPGYIELIKQDGYGQQGSITASLSGTTLTLTADETTTIKTVTIIKS